MTAYVKPEREFRRGYPDYKDAPVPWIGRIPAHWGIAPVKRVVESMCDGPFGSDMKSSHYADDGVRLIRLQNIGTGAFDDSDRAYIPEGHFLSLPGHDVMPGDVLVAGLGDANHPVGRACLFPPELGQAMVKADCFRLRLHEREIQPAFLVNFLCSTQARDGLTLATRGATRDRVNLTGIGQLAVPLPPIAEQREIVRFLDHETAVIGGSVERKKRLIALLEEKRAALINRAVTKGVDPNAPMKDSGVPWLGCVPAHWQIRRLKHISSFLTSGSRGWAEHYSDDGPIFLRIGNLTRDGIDLDLSDIQRVQPPPRAEGERTSVRAGDLLVSITADIGSVAIVPADLGRGFCKPASRSCPSALRASVAAIRWLRTAGAVTADSVPAGLVRRHQAGVGAGRRGEPLGDVSPTSRADPHRSACRCRCSSNRDRYRQSP